MIYGVIWYWRDRTWFWSYTQNSSELLEIMVEIGETILKSIFSKRSFSVHIIEAIFTIYPYTCSLMWSQTELLFIHNYTEMPQFAPQDSSGKRPDSWKLSHYLHACLCPPNKTNSCFTFSYREHSHGGRLVQHYQYILKPFRWQIKSQFKLFHKNHYSFRSPKHQTFLAMKILNEDFFLYLSDLKEFQYWYLIKKKVILKMEVAVTQESRAETKSELILHAAHRHLRLNGQWWITLSTFCQA